MFNPGYYSRDELESAGFKALGGNISIARNCTLVGMENMSIGDNVRIDGYCSIIAAGSGYVNLGSYIHIGGYCLLSAGDGIEIQDFSGLSHGSYIYSRSDDYSGKHLTNPTVPEQYTNIIKGPVTLERHVIIGSGSIILPNITIGEGSAIGAHSLVTKSLDSWGVYIGSPAKRLKSRSKRLLELEKQLIEETSQ